MGRFVGRVVRADYSGIPGCISQSCDHDIESPIEICAFTSRSMASVSFQVVELPESERNGRVKGLPYSSVPRSLGYIRCSFRNFRMI
jgi:hypothetical protein